jgi:uncharacterized OB-fold protein
VTSPGPAGGAPGHPGVSPAPEPGAGAPPVPLVTPLDEHFWRGGATGRLLILRCDRCGFWLHPPGPVCRRCLALTLTPTPVSGRGRVRTYTVNHQPWFPALPVPYALAIVELEEQEGLQFLTRLVGCRPENVRAGLAVTVRFEPHGDVHLPVFAPAAPTDAGAQR